LTGIVILWTCGIVNNSYTFAAGIEGEATKIQSPTKESDMAAQEPSGALADSRLGGTGWRLLGFQSMDDAIGTVRSADPSLYTMRLNNDGTVTMRLNCNRATGTWNAEPAGDGTTGRFRFGPLAMTRAMCPPPSMDENIAAQAEYMRSYLLKDGKLYLSLQADAGIYEWERDAVVPTAEGIPAAPEDGGPRNWVVTGVSSTLNLREQPSTRAGVVSSLAPGAILDNLGCQGTGDGVWCDVQQLGGGPRGYVSIKFLKPAISPDGSVQNGPDDSALRAGRGEFDATGQLSCARYEGKPMGQCDFGVSRAGGGYATIIIKHPDGQIRIIFFSMGVPIGADTSQADGYPEFRVTKEGDLYGIRIGNERYEIPDAVILGG